MIPKLHASDNSNVYKNEIDSHGNKYIFFRFGD